MIDPAEILDKRFYCDRLGSETTLRGWLKDLLLKVWEEGEGFSGKRPWGNGGWEWDLAADMVKGKVIEGNLDADGYLEDTSEDFEPLIANCIKAL